MTILDTESSKKLSQFLRDNPESKTGEKLPLMFNGDRTLFHVYKIPIDLLTYNVNNGRLRVEVLRFKRRTGKDVDPWSLEGRAFLEEKLLAQKGKEELLESLDQTGQIEPGLITYDGVVINANRRMAGISELKRSCTAHPAGKHDYLIAAILPPNVGDEELFHIEANLQFGFDYKEKYGPMNELLKIREGRRFQEPRQLAAMLGKSKSEIEEKLRILELIEDYLAQIGHPSEYEMVSEKDAYSSFAELPALLEKLESSGRDDDTSNKYMTVAFAMIKGRSEHRAVRKLKKLCELQGTMENRILELVDSGTLTSPPNDELRQRIENRLDEAESYIRQEETASAPLDIVDDLIARVELLQPKRDAPYRATLLEKLGTLREKILEKISLLSS